MDSRQPQECLIRIAIYAFDGVPLFHLAVPQTVFDEVTRQGLGDWHSTLFSLAPGGVTTAEGYVVDGIAGAEAARDADVLVVPSWFDDGRIADEALQRILRDGHDRGAVVAGLCLGALPVADSGLLDGRRAVTHWHALDRLAERRPTVLVDSSVLYIDHGDVLTSAGTASGIDACLHLVRTRLGADAANTVARSLLVAPHREGGQAQYIERPVPLQPADDPIALAMQWALRHLAEQVTVDELATVALMSRRSFIRAFRRSTGTTPARLGAEQTPRRGAADARADRPLDRPRRAGVRLRQHGHVPPALLERLRDEPLGVSAALRRA